METRWKILIYNGPGTKATDVVRRSVEDTILKEPRFGGGAGCGIKQFEIGFVSWQDFQTQQWAHNVKLLILPGGRDLPYVEKITADSIKSIRSFITSGGSLLGICAGAYFSCSCVEFEKNTPLEVCGTRKLKLFCGTGRGCVYPNFEYNSTGGSRMAPLNFFKSVKPTPDVNKLAPAATKHATEEIQITPNATLIPPDHIQLAPNTRAYYNGGGEFIPYGDFNDFEPLAWYKDFPDKLAIVSRHMESGKMILSFVHPEMCARYLDRKKYTTEQWEIMVQCEQEQTILFQRLLSFLLS